VSHEDFLVALQKELIEKGKLIEAGWISLRIAVIDKDASPLQLEEMRNAFFAGAQHLFASMLAVLDPGSEEPTANDLRRMELIADELQAFIDEFSKRHGLPR
jgi:hypothetical protein